MIKKRNRLQPRAVGIFFSDPWAVAATIVLLLLVSACVLLPFFLKYNYRQADYTITLQGPTAEHLLGTDNLGRDMLPGLSTWANHPWHHGSGNDDRRRCGRRPGTPFRLSGRKG
jgi:ABC-type dipeptide/oligopeptide/nickel transport system permease subunit